MNVTKPVSFRVFKNIGIRIHQMENGGNEVAFLKKSGNGSTYSFAKRFTVEELDNLEAAVRHARKALIQAAAIQ